MTRANVLWSDTPLIIDPAAPNHGDGQGAWQKAVYPIGNGRLGGTVFGEPRRDRIQFNHDSLWVGNEDNTGAYQPFGDLYIDLPHPTFRNYRRELDIDRAVQAVRYEAEGVEFRREYFASRPAGLIVVSLTADRAGALSGVVTMGNLHGIPIAVEADTLVMRGDTSNFEYWRLQTENPDRLIAGREYASDKNIDLDFEARVRVLHVAGTVRAEGASIRFNDCNSLMLLLAADTNYVADRRRGWRGEHPHRRVVDRISKASDRSYRSLLEEHVADYRGLRDRLDLQLGEGLATTESAPTVQRVATYAEQARAVEPARDRDLESLLYHYARYLMIASSAPGDGTLPANLQGIWNINRRPSWRCDFHTDVNIQMNYWFANGSNLGDCFEPLAHWVDSIREVRKEETLRVLGVSRGWLMRSENGIFGGSTWHIQKGDSAWLCQNLWDHYAFTQDATYLKRYAYPVMREISEFWVEHLKELPDGVLVVPAGRSPEHGPVGVDGVTYDQVLCWDLFNNTIEAAEVLGVDAELREQLVQKRDRLLKPRIGRWGQLQEWMEDIDDPKDDHRHVNHLICVYPGRQIHPSITPELAAAASVGLKARRDHGQGHPAWSRVWKACMFARLLDAESAYNELSTTLAKHIYDNLWAVHPPFQIDANFGFAAAVNEMLLQSHLQTEDRTHILHLLPALPTAWKDGRVRGLRARGGFELEMSWRDQQLTEAKLRNVTDATRSCVVRYRSSDTPLKLAPGEAHQLRGLTHG